MSRGGVRGGWVMIGVGTGALLRGCTLSTDAGEGDWSGSALDPRRELVLPRLPRGSSALKPPPPSPLPVAPGEFWLSFPLPDDSFLVDAKASRNRPTGDGLRFAEEGGASRVWDFIKCGLPVGNGGTGGIESVFDATSSAEISGEDCEK